MADLFAAPIKPGAPRMVSHDNGKTWNPVPGANGASIMPSAGATAAAAERVKALGSDYDVTSSLVNQAHAAAARDANVNTSPLASMLYGIPVVGGAARVIAGATNPDFKAMDSASVSMAKNLRAQGQRLTQMEWMRNLTAVPSPTNTSDGNKAIVSDYDTAKAQALDKLTFAQNWVRQHGDDTGMDAAYVQHQKQTGTGTTPVTAGGWKLLGAQ